MTSVLIRSACAFATFADTTITKVLPGLLLDAISSKQPPPTLKSFQQLATWGKTKGGQKLNLCDLQSKRWYLFPLEYVRTSFIAAARKTYFYATDQIAERKVAERFVQKISTLVETHYEDANQPDRDSFTDEMKKTIGKIHKNDSLLTTLRNLPHQYPNTRTRYYLAWGIRCGVFYYLSPTHSSVLNALVTATCLYAWTILLTPGARKDLTSIPIPAAKQKTTLPQSAKEEIIASAKRLFSSKKNKAFVGALGTLKVKSSISNPFPKNARDLKEEHNVLQKKRNSHREGTSKWYQANWEMKTTAIAYRTFGEVHATLKQKHIKDRKTKWLEWHKADQKSALSFIRGQPDVSEKEWQKWISKKAKVRLLGD
ncbi:MAG: hypothetical protein KR126chlam3_01159 [Chlamydiae bacterium]|nr:hypothetical protein [Chlamydiota bacterium]